MNKNITININAGTIIKILVILGITALLWQLRELVLIIVTSIVLASATEPGIKFFTKLKLPRVFSVLIVYVLFIGLFVGIIYAFVPVLLQETSGLLKDMPTLTEALESDSVVTAVLPDGVNISGLQDSLGELITTYSSNAFAFLNMVFGGLLTFVLIVVFSFYFAVEESNMRDFIRIIAPKKKEKYAIDLLKRSQRKVGRWMQGQLLSGLIIGMLTYLGLTIIGVKYALLLSAIVVLFGLIPVFGIILATIPAVAIGFVTGGTTMALLVLALYLIVQQFEGNLIYPLIVTRVVGVPPLMVMLALIVGAQLAGFLGILLSVPLAAVLQEVVKDLDKWKHDKLA